MAVLHIAHNLCTLPVIGSGCTTTSNTSVNSSLSLSFNGSPTLPTVQYCDYVPVNVTGGQKPYTMMVYPVPSSSPSVDRGTLVNIILGEDDDAVLWPHTAPWESEALGETFLCQSQTVQQAEYLSQVAVIDSAGAWSQVPSAVQLETPRSHSTCNLQIKTGKSDDLQGKAPGKSHSAKEKTIIVSIVVVVVVLAIALTVLGLVWYRRRQSRQRTAVTVAGSATKDWAELNMDGYAKASGINGDTFASASQPRSKAGRLSNFFR